MKQKINLKDLEFFYDNFVIESPILVIIKIFLTLGLYVIFWIYKMNRALEKVDENAPDSRRGVIIICVIPPFIFILSAIFEKLFNFNKVSIITFNVVVWSFIIFLTLKYIYDFFMSFGKWTGSSGLFWYLVFYPGYFSLILSIFGFYYALPLLFFTIVSIPSMQGYINIKEREFRELYERSKFNWRARAE